MRAILVDDEPLALSDLQNQLAKLGGIEVIGTFVNPWAAIEQAVELEPDAVFLDIDMPELTGIELAERLQSHLPQIQVVFITAYEEYAIKAFEINAIDYLLKPLQSERLAWTIERLATHAQKRHTTKTAIAEKLERIICFQCLQFEFSRPESIPWRTSKAQELFAYLLHKRHQPVRKETLLDLLWPDIESKKAYTQLYTAIYRIRKTLEAYQIPLIIHNVEKGYLLDLNGVPLDVQEWEDGLVALPPLSALTVEDHMDILHLYRGDYLADYGYLWAESESIRLRTQWLKHGFIVGEQLERLERNNEALGIYMRMLQLCPQAEELYYALMKLYAKLDDRQSVNRYYFLLVQMMESEYGSPPAPPVAHWYREWKNAAI